MDYLKLITPLNIAEEKDCFFNSKTYEPQFVYGWDKAKLETVARSEPHLAPLCNALFTQDPQAFAAASRNLFDVVFRPEDLALAQRFTRHTPKLETAGVQELAEILALKLTRLGIDYRVEIVNKHGFKCRPDHRAKVIRLSSYLRLQFPSAESVANHELVHVIRAINGTHNSIPKQSGYLPTEEGLACLVQDRLFVAEDVGSVFLHALEYLAANVSQQAGLRAVYNFLRDHGCNAENAWTRGIRCKFGLTDASRRGGLLKSAMYFYHAQLLRGLDEETLLRLFVGKIRQDQLADYPQYTGKVSAENIKRLWS